MPMNANNIRMMPGGGNINSMPNNNIRHGGQQRFQQPRQQYPGTKQTKKIW